jgi:hypothetical protein
MEEQLPQVNAVPRAYLYTILQFHLLVLVLYLLMYLFLLQNFHTINYLQFYFFLHQCETVETML